MLIVIGGILKAAAIDSFYNSGSNLSGTVLYSGKFAFEEVFLVVIFLDKFVQIVKVAAIDSSDNSSHN